MRATFLSWGLWVCCFMLPQVSFGANFLETWLANNDQAAGSRPGYYKGGRYAYANGGSFSGRIQLKKTPLFSATPPSFSVGCGGIDVFTGSYGMVDANYLIKRAQKIIDAAPYAAFDLALKVLCSSCANTMKDIQNALDRLNNLQLDECAASKAMVATLASPMSDDPNIANDINNFKISTGASDMWSDTVNDFRSSGGKASSTEVDSLLSGCTKAAKDIFGTPGSVLEHTATKLGYPASHIDAARAMFGDIMVSKTQGYSVSYDPPCADSLDPNLERIINGGAKTKPLVGGVGKCRDMPSGTRNLVQLSQSLLNSIYHKEIRKLDLTDSEHASMQTTRLPLQSLMRLAIHTGSKDALIDEFSVLLANERAYKMVLDLTLIAEQASVTAISISSKNSPQANNCKVEVIKGAVEGIQKLATRAKTARAVVRQAYANALSNSQNMMARLEQEQKLQEKASADQKRSYHKSFLLHP